MDDAILKDCAGKRKKVTLTSAWLEECYFGKRGRKERSSVPFKLGRPKKKKKKNTPQKRSNSTTFFAMYGPSTGAGSSSSMGGGGGGGGGMGDRDRGGPPKERHMTVISCHSLQLPFFICFTFPLLPFLPLFLLLLTH